MLDPRSSENRAPDGAPGLGAVWAGGNVGALRRWGGWSGKPAAKKQPRSVERATDATGRGLDRILETREVGEGTEQWESPTLREEKTGASVAGVGAGPREQAGLGPVEAETVLGGSRTLDPELGTRDPESKRHEPTSETRGLVPASTRAWPTPGVSLGESGGRGHPGFLAHGSPQQAQPDRAGGWQERATGACVRPWAECSVLARDALPI